MRLSFRICLLLIFCSGITYSQEYRYARYDVNNGLAGSTVYAMLQDRQGFMWFGTETGVSRFDGTHFRNLGTGDGLPDNEILQMFEDSKGRIWMLPFKKTVCYYYKGKIYNSGNDSVLKQIKPNFPLGLIAEDDSGNILIMGFDQLFLVSGHEVTRFDSINGLPIKILSSISKRDGGGFLLIEGANLYSLIDKKISLIRPLRIPLGFQIPQFSILNPSFAIARTSQTFCIIYNLKTNAESRIPFYPDHLTYQLLGDSLLMMNTHSGTLVYSLRGSHNVRKFMHNKGVSKTCIDNEGNYWFSTLGEGVYRLASENMFSIGLKNARNQKLNATLVKTAPRNWLIGTSNMHVFEISYDTNFSIQKKIIWDDWGTKVSARVLGLEPFGNGQFIYGTDETLEIIPRDLTDIRSVFSATVKSIYKKSDSEVFVGTRSHVFLFRVPYFKVLDTFWRQRSTAVFYRNDTLYVGTLDGLVIVKKDKTILLPREDEPVLGNRVTAIAGSPDGLVWVATSGGGVVGLRGGKIERRITTSQGLSSDNCRAIAIKEGEIWVGTDKGLNRVLLQPDNLRIVKFTEGDGLNSNGINSVGLDGNIVVVGTPEGINYFNADKISFASRCNLVMNDIIVSGRHLDPAAQSFTLAHSDNNVRFDFVGISFRSGGEITYDYRLRGLDTTWLTTNENSLSYPTLPSGNYTLELRAVNKFGIESELISIPFTIEKLLVEKTWFRLLTLAGLLLIATLFVYWLVRRVRKKDLEKSEIRRRIAELEQLALKSQMNPHFIFNCLNSIQQFVLDKDVEGSNKFITGFSRLIRQTLDISARKEIPLSEEIIYLSTYLELEMTRFENKFTYEVTLADGVNPEQLFIPPMMLQPFVENSIRHGLRYRPDSLGKIMVNFDKMDGELVCLIEDNGVGRDTARLLKGRNPIEYQSKGMSLIADRVEFLNQNVKNPITIKIEDLTDQNRKATGTRVIMKFPLENGY